MTGRRTAVTGSTDSMTCTGLRRAAAAGLVLAASAGAQDGARDSGRQDDLRSRLFAEADAALEAARDADAALLAPESFEAGLEAYREAEEDLADGRSADRIRAELGDAVASLERAADAAGTAADTLASTIEARDDASAASAATFAAELWGEAEEAFDDAARELESDDVDDARERASEAETLYRDAELAAIKARLLSQTRALLAEAEQARVPRYAPRTLERARALLERAERGLDENRYDTERARRLAQQASREARRAMRLAEDIRGYREQDDTEEAIILRYEQTLARIAGAADQAAPLDEGIEPVADELVTYIEQLRERARQAERELEDSRTRIAELEEQVRELDERLGGVSRERVDLVRQLEAENRIREQFDTIENMFTPDEARIAREGNQLVLSLVGLTFASGSAEVRPEHGSLLEKVGRAASVFPRAQIVVEGHTDSYGDDDANMALSRDRAEAVSGFLSGELGIEPFRISAVGYGETQPIANNETERGRARNRRIDIRIEPQLE